MPFTRFMEGVSALLRRPVFTHEFANPDVLWAEFCQQCPAPDIITIISRFDGMIAILRSKPTIASRELARDTNRVLFHPT